MKSHRPILKAARTRARLLARPTARSAATKRHPARATRAAQPCQSGLFYGRPARAVPPPARGKALEHQHASSTNRKEYSERRAVTIGHVRTSMPPPRLKNVRRDSWRVLRGPSTSDADSALELPGCTLSGLAAMSATHLLYAAGVAALCGTVRLQAELRTSTLLALLPKLPRAARIVAASSAVTSYVSVVGLCDVIPADACRWLLARLRAERVGRMAAAIGLRDARDACSNELAGTTVGAVRCCGARRGAVRCRGGAHKPASGEKRLADDRMWLCCCGAAASS